MMNSTTDSPTNLRNDSTNSTGPAKPRLLAAIWPGEWWLVFNLYLIVIVLLAVAGSALEI